MTDVKLDAGRLVVLEANRHRANQRAIEAGHEARDVHQQLQVAEREVAKDENAYRANFGDFNIPIERKAVNRQGEAEARRRVEQARQKRDALKDKARAAGAAHEQASAAFQAAARLHERCTAYAKRNGLDVPSPPDRGESLAYASMGATIVSGALR